MNAILEGSYFNRKDVMCFYCLVSSYGNLRFECNFYENCSRNSFLYYRFAYDDDLNVHRIYDLPILVCKPICFFMESLLIRLHKQLLSLVSCHTYVD